MHRLARAVPVVLVLISLATLFTSRGVTVPLYAARTGLLCQNCHFDRNGGGPRNEFGFAFARNRHAIEPEDSTSAWHDLSVVNRIGDAMPVYLGVNQRFMLLASTSAHRDSIDEFGFYNMESAIHIAFQPHQRLLMVYTRDGFDAGSSTKEAFGMISGFPVNGYLQAGRFRNPFGLRWDDHTVATRNGFLDFFNQRVPFTVVQAGQVRGSYLPYDPRQPDMGVEVGGDQGMWFGRASFTNGGTHPLFGGSSTNAQAVAGKVGFNLPQTGGSLSFYDDFHEVTAFPSGTLPTRSTRWGYTATAHAGPMAFLGEIGAGTDKEGAQRFNSLAWVLEADYRLSRGVNLRARWDRMELYRDDSPAAPSTTTLNDLNTHDRYAIEGEFDPVPFAQLRWTLRWIDHKADQFPDSTPISDERQAYLQFHFIY